MLTVSNEIMDIFKEDKAIFKSGALKSAFKWSLLAYPIFFALNFLGVVTLFINLLFGLLLLVVVPNIILIFIYYFALKRGISKFRLTTYSLRVEYLAIITILVLIYDVLIMGIINGKLEFPQIGILPLIIMLLVPYFVKE